MKNIIDCSRKKTPWDSEQKISPLQRFIKNKYQENYDFKHPKLSDTKEYELINCIKVNKCRCCGSSKIKKNEKNVNKVQKYYCMDCRKNFISTTNTIFDNHKISITEWIEFLLDIFNYGSTSLTSRVNKNSINIARYWLNKVFIVLEKWQESTILTGKVYIDELFYKEIKSKIVTKDGKNLGEISQNQYCIGIGYDGNNILAKVEGMGKPTRESTGIAFLKHIASGSELIHDGEKSHNIILENLNLINTSYSSVEIKKLDDKNNPLRKINHQCDLIRQFLNTHSGFDRNNLQGYLNLYCFMNSGHKDRLDLVKEFLELALNTNTALNYRENFKSNVKKNH